MYLKPYEIKRWYYFSCKIHKYKIPSQWLLFVSVYHICFSCILCINQAVRILVWIVLQFWGLLWLPMQYEFCWLLKVVKWPVIADFNIIWSMVDSFIFGNHTTFNLNSQTYKLSAEKNYCYFCYFDHSATKARALIIYETYLIQLNLCLDQELMILI